MTRATMPPLSAILLGDQGDPAIPFSDKIYLLIDKNGDGDAADEGERQVFFDETNASGLGDPTPTGNILNLTQGSDGAVYAGDGDTDALYRLKDLNGDGDANDEGEASLWFGEAQNAAGFTLPTPNGVAEGADGAVYIVNAGVASRPADAIYRTVDLNGDGDANDAGEASLWLDLSALVPTSSPFDLSFIGDRGYLIDPSGGAEDSVYTFRDNDGSGAIEADEFATFATRTDTGAPIDFTQTADGASIVVWEWLDRESGVYSAVRLTDHDGSGAIDQPDETVEIWNTDELPDVFDTFAGFSVAADGKGRLVLTSNGSDAFEDNVYVLDDKNGDGDYFDTGETNILASRAFDGETLQRPRSLAFYEGTVNRSDTVLAAGNHFSLFLDAQTSTVYAAGENLFGQLAQGVTGFDVPAPLEIALPEGFDGTIVSIAAGLLHGSFLTEDGDVYVWGFGNFGRLGLGDEEDRLVATKIEGALDDERVVVIDHGNGASFAITDTGTLYGWGQNSSGQLGLGDEERRLTPTEIDIEGKAIVALSSGVAHTLALAADGSVYGFGSNRDGQAAPDALEAPGEPVDEVLAPTKVEGLPQDIAAITADAFTSFAVTSDGRLFGWGENSFGQLLVGTDNGDGTFVPTDERVLTPIELDMPGRVIDVKGGARWFAALTEDGDVYLWGPNDEGPTGGLDGDPAAESDASFFPTKLAALDDVTIVEIQTGPNHVLAIDDEGTVYAFGSNADGRLGYPSDGSVYEPQPVTLAGDAAPYLLAATPADNARDVAPSAAVVLTFTEDVFPQPGEIRFVNRDDPEDVLLADTTDPYLVRVIGNTVTVYAPDYFAPDARYAVEITAGAFEDASGEAFPGIAEGDTSTFNFTVADTVIDNLRIIGTTAPELLRGASEEDVLIGRGGDDSLIGNGEEDVLLGGAGSDTLRGGEDDDVLFGAAGEDSLSGDAGSDTIVGGSGADTLDGGEGDDHLRARTGSDRLSGEAGDDTLKGGEGRDTLDGGEGDDRAIGGGGRDLVRGGAGNDTLGGQGGNDVLLGETGNDRLIGGEGNDTLVAGDGNDRLDGGPGRDVYDFDSDDGRNVIIGFDPARDTIRLADDTAFMVRFDSASGDTIVDYGATRIIVRDVALPVDAITRQPLKVIALTGVDATDFAGISVADAGDVDGDGTPDVVVGAYSADRGDVLSGGEAYVVSGTALAALGTTGGAGTLSLGDLGGGTGVLLRGEAEVGTYFNTGWSVSSAGDVDGDGLDDVLVGAFGASTLAGRTYLVYGAALAEALSGGGEIDFAALEKAQGVVLQGANVVDFSGYQVTSLGDIDGDGLDDFAIGAGQAAGFFGETYVVFGAAMAAESGADGDGFVDVGALSGADGVTIVGAEFRDIMGFQVSGAGDVDNDGLPDLMLGGWTASPGGVSGAGKAVLVFGAAVEAARTADGVIDLAAVTAADSLVFNGLDAGDATGRSVAAAGDVDGDGFGEVLVGSYLAEVGGQTWVGEVALLDGAFLAEEKAAGGAAEVDLSDLSGGRGVLIRGDEQRDLTGFSVSDAGDVDGGGTPDILIGAYGLNPAGGAYVLFGEALRDELGPDGDGILDLSDLGPKTGARINGIKADDVAGWQVSGAGDVDGDGLQDILMGAWEGDLAGADDAGEAYLITGAAIAEAAQGNGVLDLETFFVPEADLFT